MTEATRDQTTPESLATLHKALGDAMRIEVLRVLATDSYGVLELADIFQVAQPRISHHLKVLATAGLVSTRREGNSIFYRRPQLSDQDPLRAVKQQAFKAIDQCAICIGTHDGLERAYKVRAALSTQFFVENTEKFREQQDLIASYNVYAQAVTDLLDSSPIPTKANALELGPGEGEFLGILCERFEHVCALDNSPSMLAKAQATASINNLSNLSLSLGDTSTLKETTPCFDVAILNMVLHHTPSPPTIFKEIYPSMQKEGVILITELCLHDQNWVKEACGDIWLGFDPADLSAWATEAGFTVGQSQYLALRNGFQIQLRQFFKH